MSWIWGAFAPHPPVLVPRVGKGREKEAAKTLEGMRQLCESLARKKPEILLLLSPHMPYNPGTLLFNSSPELSGSLSRFGAPDLAFSLSTPVPALEHLSGHLAAKGVMRAFCESPNITADHGSLVPLHFLAECWQGLPPVVFASPIGLTPRQSFAFGEALADFSDTRTWGLLASGDLSHRLTPSAPSGYDPAGAIFDKAVVDALASGRAEELLALAPNVVKNAGECGLRSACALLGLAGKPLRVFSYEGPFGVGYCTALVEM